MTGGHNPVCTIRLAVPGRYRTGETDPRRTHINVVTYSGQAEAVANHMGKGGGVGVAGEYREWKSTDNVPHSIYEVVAARVDSSTRRPSTASPPTARTRSL